MKKKTRAVKRTPKKINIELMLPPEVAHFVSEVSALADVSVETVIMVNLCTRMVATRMQWKK